MIVPTEDPCWHTSRILKDVIFKQLDVVNHIQSIPELRMLKFPTTGVWSATRLVNVALINDQWQVEKRSTSASGAWCFVASAGVRGWVGSVNFHVGTLDWCSFFQNHVQRWQSGEILQRIATALKPKMETERVQLLNAFSGVHLQKMLPWIASICWASTAQDPDWYTKVHPQRKNDEHMAGA